RVRSSLVVCLLVFFLITIPLPPTSTLFPYTTLFRSLNLRKTLLMASSVRLKPLNCSRLPCVYAQETLTFLLTQKKTSVFPARTRKRSEERFSRNAETDLVCRLLLEKKKKKRARTHSQHPPPFTDMLIRH